MSAPPSINLEPASPGQPSYRRSNVTYGQSYTPTPASQGATGGVADMAATYMGPGGADTLARVRVISSQVEDVLETFARPLRPYLPGLGRFLIVVTFLEDALRILTQVGGECTHTGTRRRVGYVC
jgi:hypothetical protein